MNFLFVGDLMELTLGGVPTYGYCMSGDLWGDTKMVSLHKTASVDGKCQERIRPNTTDQETRHVKCVHAAWFCQ